MCYDLLEELHKRNLLAKPHDVDNTISELIGRKYQNLPIKAPGYIKCMKVDGQRPERDSYNGELQLVLNVSDSLLDTWDIDQLTNRGPRMLYNSARRGER